MDSSDVGTVLSLAAIVISLMAMAINLWILFA